MEKIRHALAFVLVCALASAFGQDAPVPVQNTPEKTEPEKFAVYVSGAGEAGINKSFSNKLLSAISQSGKYAEIGEWEAFFNELAKSHDGSTGQISQAAKKYGADVVCVVSMTEAFGAYSISAKLVKASDAQVIKTALLDRSLKSLEDLTTASNELSAQLLGLQPQEPVPEAPPVPPSLLVPPPSEPPAPPPVAAAPVPQKECANKFNINELVFKIQSGFTSQLKDCSTTLAKEIALSKSPFAKKAAPEPKSFMMSCTIDGIKQKLSAGAADYIKPIEGFVQNLLKAASAADGSLDVQKLSGMIGGLNVNDLINEIKSLASGDACAVDEPYSPPPVAVASSEADSSGEDDDEGVLSFGIRVGFNFSHLYANYNSPYGGTNGTYNSTPGFQLGFVLDIAASDWFHIQPGVMYIQKGAEDDRSYYGSYYGEAVTTLDYVEIPVLLSLKFSALRINAGPYFGICANAPDYINTNIDVGFNAGLGFDIGMFYIGGFYEFGFVDVSNRNNFEFYNRTLGFNFGVNL